MMNTRERDGVHLAALDAEDPPVRGAATGRGLACRSADGRAAGPCDRCREIGRVCPSCVQRRRQAWLLVVERGETYADAGRIMGLRPQLVRRLVDAENDRRELRSLRCDTIPVQRTQAVIAEALARDPDLTIADVARWLDMRQADFDRAFLGKGRAGRTKKRVSVTNASRLMIALGRAPNELEGC